MSNVHEKRYEFEVDKAQFNISLCLAGHSNIHFTDGAVRPDTILHSPSICTISYLREARGIWEPIGESYSLATLNINPHAFGSVWRTFGKALPRELRPLAYGDDPHPFFMGLAITPAIQQLIAAMLHDPVPGPGRELMRECKMMELLIHIATLLTNGKSRNAKAIPLSSADMERIHAAKTLLENSMEEPPSLTELARQAGLNEFKLKRGFRQVFGDTPYRHLRKVRLEQARSYLEKREMNVYEACVAVGYSSLSNFIALFKREFGITPGKVLQCALRDRGQA